MKKKLTVGLILVIVLILTTLTAMAIELMTGKEVVEQVAVPMAQNNELWIRRIAKTLVAIHLKSLYYCVFICIKKYQS